MFETKCQKMTRVKVRTLQPVLELARPNLGHLKTLEISTLIASGRTSGCDNNCHVKTVRISGDGCVQTIKGESVSSKQNLGNFIHGF